ncbi:unnamed protein product [Urochloa decumbens]|uniref:FBD domain-containing protein n=1 Tax=Urochloa decumbens TaxID=240449 RepID=A0ABC9DEM1_9POAL
MDQYASFVNGILARRTQSDCAVESLDILYKTTDSNARLDPMFRRGPAPAGPSNSASTAWSIRHFDYDEDHVSNKDGDGDEKKPMVLLDELPSPTRLETMRLALGGHTRLRLPASMKFASLTDLSLEKIKFVDGGARLLARLVSSVSCPLLQKLRMTKLGFPNFNEEMLLEAEVLSELWVEDVNVVAVELKTPRLRVLLVDKCYHEVFEEDVDIIRSRVPHLPHITTLIVNVSLSFERHDFGAGVASLLTRFSLRLPFFLTMNYDLRAGLGLSCDPQDHWTSNEFSVDHLQEVELRGLTGVDCELWFMKAVFTSARGLRKVAVSFYPTCWQHEDKMDAFERICT